MVDRGGGAGADGPGRFRRLPAAAAEAAAAVPYLSNSLRLMEFAMMVLLDEHPAHGKNLRAREHSRPSSKSNRRLAILIPRYRRYEQIFGRAWKDALRGPARRYETRQPRRKALVQ